MHFFTVFSLLISVFLSLCSAQRNTTFQVGVILDVDSLVARIGMTSLSLALSDFYSFNLNYSTRLVLHSRDSRGLVTGAAASALNLLKDAQVDAIIGPQTSAQANFVIGLGGAAKVPVISFTATSPSLRPQTPYFVQTAINDAAQVNAVAAIVKYFRWYQVVFVYEDSDYGNGIIPYLSNAFQQVNARVSYRSVIPVSASDDFILQEMYKMKTMQTRVFVVHASRPIASRIFLKAKEAEMMSEGYVWIVTSGLMDLFYSLDSKVVESMQGVVGVKPLVPRSSRLVSTTIRWKKKFADDNPGITPQEDINLYGLWAYDTLWALAMAAEKTGFKEPTSLPNTTSLNSTDMFVTGTSQTGSKLLATMLDTKFEGLAGNFNLDNGQLESSSFQILNVDGNSLKEVGIWKPLLQISSQRNTNLTGFVGEKLENIIWPGKSRNVPKGWEVPVSGKKLRVGVPVDIGFAEYVNVQRDPQTNATTITGYYIDLFDSVMAALPYSVRYEYAPFEKSDGSIAGSYDDLTYQVFNGEYDAAVGDITITGTRSQYVDFTLQIEEGGVTRTQRIEYENPNDLLFFFKPLKRDLWLTALAMLILTGVALWILEHRHNEDFRGSHHAGLIFYVPFTSLVFAYREKIVTNLARAVIVVWIFVVLILNSTYTASLSARLTAIKLLKVDTDVTTLIRNGDYVGCREGTYIIEFLKRLGFDESKIRTYKLPEDFDIALSKGSGNGGITAFFARTPYMELFLARYCNKYMKVGTPYYTEGFAFAFPKGSPLVADVSRAIIKLTDNHKIAEIKERWIKQSACKEDDLPNSSSANIGLKSFTILFSATGIVTGFCLVLYMGIFFYSNKAKVKSIWTDEPKKTVWSKIGAICTFFGSPDPKYIRPDKEMTWSKFRAVCKFFYETDAKSFPRHGENAVQVVRKNAPLRRLNSM
ncbi:hypothetical protein ABFX02_09G128007 [Erythranthe guttata]